ncbi:DNA translocase FtsK 4TM domain-containing protein [candidate division WOR-3 bacterium]|nr:DNA translocase FtsK 4TM domain-containing protein [candidate division WOR-3 bacterium]
MSYWLEILKWVLYIIMTGLGIFAIGWIGRELFRVLLKLTPNRRLELGRICLILVALLILVSLGTFNKKDYGNLSLQKVTLSENITNKGGVVGVLVSLWLYGILGLSSYFIPIILLLWGILPKRYYTKLSLQSVFLLGIAIITCFLLTSFKVNGGIVGDKISLFLTNYFGIGKWFIISAFLFALLLTLKEFRKIIFKVRHERPCPKPKKPIPVPAEEITTPTEITKPVESSRLPLDISMFSEIYLSKLHEPEPVSETESEQELQNRAKTLKSKFEEFEVTGKITKIAPGPVITRYEYEPAPGIKVSKVASLADDIALSMKAPRIRIVSPIPGKSVIGIEIPNRKRNDVYLKEILMSQAFKNVKSKLGIVLGKDIAGEPVCADIAGFPHLLIAGATGSGKSVCINSMVASILYKVLPSEVRFLMIDPKRLELPVYNGIPHLVRPVISNAKEALSALKDIIDWMELRYREFARAGVRDIDGYNQKAIKPKPYILIIVDELADLIITAPREIEFTLTRLAQMSRAVGIHLILATQRPSVDVITGLIKANFPARIAFQVASKTDSRTILDMNGAEKLLGKGDMLFIPPGKGTPERLHGTYISTQEAKSIANLWTEKWLVELLTGKIGHPKDIARDIVDEDLIEFLVFKEVFPGAGERIKLFANEVQTKYGLPAKQTCDLLLGLEYYPKLEEEAKIFEKEEEKEEGITVEEFDELFEEAKGLVVRHQLASVSLLQRHFKIGYARAGRIIDQLERAGVIGPYVGSKSREVLIPRNEG